VSVVYNGLDYNHWNKKYDGERIRAKLGLKNNFVYMMTGRPGVSKGHEYLIKAASIISKKIRNSKLVLITSKEKQNHKRYLYIKKIIKKLGLQQHILILDPVPWQDLPNYLKAADCVVVPSLTEGFGYNVVEANTLNIPVVASNVYSIPEVISGRYVLVKPKDKNDIARGIEQVYQKKVIQKPLKRFSIEDNISEYLKIYRELISPGIQNFS
jgi:glycosyltransferase involved in cell wall biosynthesis